MEDGKEESLFRSEFYADLGAAADSVKHAYGAKETTVETAKFAGKAAWNALVLLGKVGAQVVEKGPAVMEKIVSDAEKKRR